MPYNANEEQLKDLFGSYGTVNSVKIIIDRETRKPKGFCFIEMEDKEALNAIENLNNVEFLGRNLRVNEAKSRI